MFRRGRRRDRSPEFGFPTFVGFDSSSSRERGFFGPGFEGRRAGHRSPSVEWERVEYPPPLHDYARPASREPMMSGALRDESRSRSPDVHRGPRDRRGRRGRADRAADWVYDVSSGEDEERIRPLQYQARGQNERDRRFHHNDRNSGENQVRSARAAGRANARRANSWFGSEDEIDSDETEETSRNNPPWEQQQRTQGQGRANWTNMWDLKNLGAQPCRNTENRRNREGRPRSRHFYDHHSDEFGHSDLWMDEFSDEWHE